MEFTLALWRSLGTARYAVYPMLAGWVLVFCVKPFNLPEIASYVAMALVTLPLFTFVLIESDYDFDDD